MSVLIDNLNPPRRAAAVQLPPQASWSPPSAGGLPQQLMSLDGVRGLAILMVLAHNITILDAPRSHVGHLTELLLNVGWIGVQLFFVLSGFLITRILLQTQSSPTYFRSFFARRVLRIFPLYYATLLFLLVVLPAFHALPAQYEAGRNQEIWLWLYLCNWTEPFSPGSSVLPHFWSLAVEEQFYLVWPFLVYRSSPRRVLWISGIVALAALVIRTGMLHAGQSSEAVYMFSICRMDALALGAAAAALTQMPGAWARVVAFGPRLWIVGGVLLALGAVVTHGLYPRSEVMGQTLGYTILALIFVAVVLAAAVNDQRDAAAGESLPRRFLRWAPLRQVGKYSYGMYIIHKPLHDLFGKPWLASHGLSHTSNLPFALLYIVVGTLVCFGLAAVIYHGFEIHFLSLKRYFTASPART